MSSVGALDNSRQKWQKAVMEHQDYNAKLAAEATTICASLECSCQEPSELNDVVELWMPLKNVRQPIFERRIYYRRSCPQHGEVGRDGLCVRERR